MVIHGWISKTLIWITLAGTPAMAHGMEREGVFLLDRAQSLFTRAQLIAAKDERQARLEATSRWHERLKNAADAMSEEKDLAEVPPTRETAAL